jgi:uncharacterized membrane protein YfcA
MDDCRTLRLRYGNQPALSAVRRGGSILLYRCCTCYFRAVQVLAATSLTVVMLSALINVCAFWRQGIRLHTRLLVLWSLGMATECRWGYSPAFAVG